MGGSTDPHGSHHMIRTGDIMGLVKTGVLLWALALMGYVAQAAPAAGSARVESTANPGSGATGPATRTSHTAVHIAVPPVAVILVNGNGSPIAVETNTSRSPRRGDMFLTTESLRSQDLSKATRAQTDQVLQTVSTMAVWQPGWHYIGRR
jgi:hypothetical protein